MPVTSRARRRRLSAPRSAPASSRLTSSRRTTRRSNLVFTVGLIATAVLLSNRSLTQKDDNRLLCFCTARPHLARHPAKGVCRQDLGARQARHDPRVQPVHLADPAVGLHRRDGHHQRRDDPAGHHQRLEDEHLARHEAVVGRLDRLDGDRSALPCTRDLGCVLNSRSGFPLDMRTY